MKITDEDSNFQYGYQPPIKFRGLKHLIYPFVNLYYHALVGVIHKFKSSKRKNNRYRLSLVLIFKDEAPYLEEWIEYHLMLGVEHFYLYQNNSTDNYQEVLKPYIKNEKLTLIDWPEYPGQYSAYLDWYRTYRNETQWVAFIDTDEFLCPIKDVSMLETLKRYDKYPVVLIYWKLFGTSGLMSHDFRKTVIEQYICCRPKLYTEGKILYNTQYDVAGDFISMHGMNVRWHSIQIPPINSFGKFVIWNFHRVNRKKNAVIQLNHYWSKAFECWVEKYKKGSIEKGTNWKDYHFFEKLEMECTDCDYTIYRFLSKLKLRMNK